MTAPHGQQRKHIQMRVNFWWCFAGADNVKITSWLKRLEIAEDSARGLWSAGFTICYLYIEYGEISYRSSDSECEIAKIRYRVSPHRMLPNNHP